MGREYENIVKTTSAEGWTRDIILYEQFDDSLKRWLASGDGAGDTVHETTEPYIGLGNVHMTTGADNGNMAYLYKGIGPAEPRLVAIKAFLNIPMVTPTNLTIDMLVKLNSAKIEKQIIAELKIIHIGPDTWTLQILDKDGNYQTIPGASAAGLWQNWSPMILLLNLNTLKYEKLITGYSISDLSQYDLLAVPLAEGSNTYIQFSLETNEAVAKELLIDRVIIDYPPII